MTQRAREKEKKRLVELLQKFDPVAFEEPNLPSEYWYGADLADYLLKNGVIVPPCKVGDTVWCAALRSIDPFIKQETVERIQYAEQGFYYGMQKGIYFEDEVFFSRKEAEQALKEHTQHE